MKNNNIPLLYDCRAKVLLVVLFFLCNIALSNNCREIYENYFFNDKELPMGNKSERLVYLTLQLFDNPKGNSAYNLFSDMSNRNAIVTVSEYANVTPIQQILVNHHFNLKKPFDFFKCYMCMLPYFKTANDAFGFVNSVAFKRHQSFTFLNLNTLKSTIYA
jgi:hypothetical protein